MKNLLANSRVRKGLIIALTALLIIGVVIAVVADISRRNEQKNKEMNFEEVTRELEVEKERLLIEYANVEKYYLNSIADGSYLGIVFTELHPDLYEDVYPLFTHRSDGSKREEKVVGFFALSDGNMPDDDNRLSRLYFDIMVEDGWQYILYWNGEGVLSEYISMMKDRFAVAGLKFPNVLMFESRQYTSEYDKYLASEGIVHVVHHGEERLPLVEKNTKDKIWHPGALGWNTRNQANPLLREIVSNGGFALFEVNFSDTIGDFLFNGDFADRTAAFGRMIDVIETLIAEDDIKVTSFDIAKEGRVRYLAAREEVLKDIEGRKAEILNRINEINQQINDAYKKYYSN